MSLSYLDRQTGQQKTIRGNAEKLVIKRGKICVEMRYMTGDKRREGAINYEKHMRRDITLEIQNMRYEQGCYERQYDNNIVLIWPKD